MNVLDMIRDKKNKEASLKAAQKLLCYRGVVYAKEAAPTA
jgi:hypothetical protein